MLPLVDRNIARLDRFTSWFVHHGGYLHQSVEFAHTESMGFHLRVKKSATDSIPVGTLVISCPHTFTISALNAVGLPQLFPRKLKLNEHEDIPPFPQQILNEGRPQCIAAFWLCLHWQSRDLKLSEGLFDPYLDCLPTPAEAFEDRNADRLGDLPDSALWWTDVEKEWLHGTNVLKGVQDLSELWHAEWERWSPLMQDWAGHGGVKLTWSLFKWAMTILGSRAFSSSQLLRMTFPTGDRVLDTFDPDMLLYPGMDSTNHSATTMNSWNCSAETFGIICNDSPKSGEQIWNSYGPKSNAELLLSYGFCIEKNIYDSFPLKLPQSQNSLVNSIRQLDLSKGKNTLPASNVIPSRIPPAFDQLENVYYIRHPDQIRSNDYPSQWKNHRAFCLAGIPKELILVFMTNMINRREKIVAQTDHAWNQRIFDLDLNTNRLYAFATLLSDRFKMDIIRLEEGGPQPDQGRNNAEISPKSSNRRQQANLYRVSQISILKSNLELLKNCINTGLLGDNLSESQASFEPDLLTCSEAFHILRILDPDVHHQWLAFKHRLAAKQPTPNTPPTSNAYTDTDWIFWIGAILNHSKFLQNVPSPDPYPKLTLWINNISKIYQPFNPDREDQTPPTLTSLQPWQEEQVDDMATTLKQTLAKLRASNPTVESETPSLSRARWPTSFIRACAEIRLDEAFEVEVPHSVSVKLKRRLDGQANQEGRADFGSEDEGRVVRTTMQAEIDLGRNYAQADDGSGIEDSHEHEDHGDDENGVDEIRGLDVGRQVVCCIAVDGRTL